MTGANLDFDNVCLVPRIVSTIESRDDIKIEVNSVKNFRCPIVASPMMDVCDGVVANKMAMNWGLGIIHRFNTIEEQVKEYLKGFPPDGSIKGCAIGVEGDSFERFKALDKVGCKLFCIDTANGAHIKVKKMIERISNSYISIMAGNVASSQCYEWLQQFDRVKFIRVGIAGGTSCTTKNATGVSRGMLSCVAECAKVKKNTVLIADGGIKEPSDMCKAIAFGADMVMLGGVLAAATDSPAETLDKDGALYKIYRGSASFEVQKEYREKPRYIEGKTSLLKCHGESIDEILNRFTEGLRSSMSYFNARTLEEYRNNVTFDRK